MGETYAEQKKIIQDTYISFLMNREALGYIFGAYNYLSYKMGIASFGHDKIMEAMENAYILIWGDNFGKILFLLSLKDRDSELFIKGQIQGEKEAMIIFTSNMKSKPTGLITIFGKKYHQEHPVQK